MLYAVYTEDKCIVWQRPPLAGLATQSASSELDAGTAL